MRQGRGGENSRERLNTTGRGEGEGKGKHLMPERRARAALRKT